MFATPELLCLQLTPRNSCSDQTMTNLGIFHGIRGSDMLPRYLPLVASKMPKLVIVWSVQRSCLKARRLWCSKHRRLARKVLCFRTIVLSVFLYSCETWPALERHTQRLEGFHVNCLRFLGGFTWRDTKTDVSVRHSCHTPPPLLVGFRSDDLGGWDM